MPHGRWSQRRDVGLEGVGDMPPVNQVTPGFREMFDARLQKSGDEVLMVELFAESWPKGTMSLHRVSDEGVGEWVFGHKRKSFPADSGTATDFSSFILL